LANRLIGYKPLIRL